MDSERQIKKVYLIIKNGTFPAFSYLPREKDFGHRAGTAVLGVDRGRWHGDTALSLCPQLVLQLRLDSPAAHVFGEKLWYMLGGPAQLWYSGG